MLTGRRISTIVMQIAVVFFWFFFITHQYSTAIYPDQIAKNHFNEGNCLLLNKKLSITSGYAQRYRADFLISYNVNGVQYQRWVAGNGLDSSYFYNRNLQESVLSRYQAGGMYSCWYDKDEPQTAIFILRHDWTDFFSLLVTAIIGLMTAYFLSYSPKRFG